MSEAHCPFCARTTRRIGLAFCAMVFTVGCGGHRRNYTVYGGPPSPPEEHVSFEVDVARDHPVLELFSAHAAAAGCKVERDEDDIVVARCSDGNIGIRHRGSRALVLCTMDDEARCRALLKRIGDSKLSQPVGKLPLDAPLLPSPTTSNGPEGADAGVDAASD